MKPPRLAELQRQRDLVRQHLAWLDAEIESAIDQPRHEPPSTAVAASVRDVAAAPGSTLKEPDPARAADDARRGCFILAVVVALLFAGTLAGIYFVKYRDRPLLFPDDPREAEAAP